MRLLITSNLLITIIYNFISRDNINITAAFKLAFVKFLRIKEFTHIKQRAADNQAFATANLTRSDVRLIVDYITVRLKRSKINRLYQEVTIIVAATGEHNCPVHALRQLFERDPQPESEHSRECLQRPQLPQRCSATREKSRTSRRAYSSTRPVDFKRLSPLF